MATNRPTRTGAVTWFPQGFLTRVSERLRKIITNITIEPPMFLIAFSSAMDNVAYIQMNIYKSCRVDFDFNATVCDNLVTDFPDQNELVQEEIAQFTVYQTIVEGLFPVFFSFYLGAWADLFGRRLIFYISLSARMMSQALVIVLAYYLVTPKEYGLIALLPTSFAGGFHGWIMVLHAFISDISEPDQRAFRMGMLHLAASLGKPLGVLVGAYLLSTGGYVCVFSASLLGVFIGSVFLIYRMKSYKWVPSKKNAERNRAAFSPLHIKDALSTTFKKRPGPNRKYIVIFMLITIFTLMALLGELSVAYIYVRTRYQWEVDEYSTYTSIVTSASIVAQAIFIPLVSLLGIRQSLIMTLVFVTPTASHLIKGFATKSWMFYVGGLVDLVGSYAMSILRAMMASCVRLDELGKVYAVLSAFESLLPMGVVQAYASLWKVTDKSYPGTVLIVSGGLSLIGLMLSSYIHFSLKGKTLSEVTAAGREMADEPKNKDKQLPDIFDNFDLSYI